MTAADAAVRVLVMAKNKKNRKENAGDTLFGRLGRNSPKKTERPDEFLGEDYDLSEDAEQEMEYDSIDVTAEGDESDSDLDINELLRKYMPEYAGEESQSGTGGGTGVLSRLKQSGGRTAESADDKLISALDSVFSSSVEEGEPVGAEEFEETAFGGEEFAEEEFADDDFGDGNSGRNSGRSSGCEGKETEKRRIVRRIRQAQGGGRTGRNVCGI